MLTKTQLVIGSIFLGVLGFSPMLVSMIGKGNKKGELKLNPTYYNDPDEPLFINEEKEDQKN